MNGMTAVFVSQGCLIEANTITIKMGFAIPTPAFEIPQSFIVGNSFKASLYPASACYQANN